jgi:4-amino-4-deoxy-L-arabinose transferase-like glycosyltransferase
VILLLASILLYSINLDGWLINDDEGTSLYAAWRVSEGDVPHRDFQSEHSPFFAFLGAGIVRMFGTSVVALRGSSVLLTILGAAFFYATFRGPWGRRTALLGSVFMLLNLEVFLQGRVFRTDTYMLFFVACGLCALAMSQIRGQRRWIALAGCLMSLGTLIKVIGVLPALGGMLFFSSQLWQDRQKWRSPLLDLMTFGLSYAVLLGAGYGLFLLVTPDLLSNLAGAQGTLGEGIALTTLLAKGAVFLALYFRSNLTLILAVPAIVAIIRRRHRLGMIMVWQLPTALVVVLMRGPQSPRYLLYLAPTWALLLAYSVEMFLRWCETVPNDGTGLRPFQRLIFVFYRAYRRTGLEGIFTILIALFVASPWVMPISLFSQARESATRSLADYIARLTEPNDYVLTDYASLNFHSQREGVYQTDIISWGHAAAGLLTGSDLIKEINTKRVKLVAIQVGPSSRSAHLGAMHDFEEFYQYVQDHYVLVREFDRMGQIFEVYLAADMFGY